MIININFSERKKFQRFKSSMLFKFIEEINLSGFMLNLKCILLNKKIKTLFLLSI